MPWDTAESNPRRRWWRSPWMWGAAAVGLMLAVLLIARPAHRLTPTQARIVCATHLRQIGGALRTYANANGGAFPPDLPTLLRTRPLDPSLLKRPADGGAYVYLGRGLTTASPATAALMADGGGRNVLYADGHVEADSEFKR